MHLAIDKQKAEGAILQPYKNKRVFAYAHSKTPFRQAANNSANKIRIKITPDMTPNKVSWPKATAQGNKKTSSTSNTRNVRAKI